MGITAANDASARSLDPVLWVVWLVGVITAAVAFPFRSAISMRTVVIVGILWPVAEEVVFRAGVQGTLLRLRWGRARWLGISGANVTASLLFACAHLIRQDPQHAALVLAPSLVFGYFRERHGGIASAVFLHVSFNLASLLAAAA